MKYDITKVVDMNYNDAIIKVKEELKKEGFGVLTEIDVKKTMKEKINAEYDNFIILGTCNPVFANKALSFDKNISLFLPCNIVVRSEGGKTIVSAIDPIAMMSPVGNKELEPLGKEAKEKLTRVINSL